MQIVRYQIGGGAPSLGLLDEGHLFGADGKGAASLAGLLGHPLDDVREWARRVRNEGAKETRAWRLLAPIDGGTEVWAAGVTYMRSAEARTEESATPDVYTRVYDAERPELFFKGNARRVAATGEPVVVRADSTWDVPEPEVALVVTAHGEIAGYTIANDVSSRSIEGQNPLYLPQAKVYAASCGLGPGITPVWEVDDPYGLTISLTIQRAGTAVWQGATSMRAFRRRLRDLVDYLFREDDHPQGVILSTGTGIVPESPFTLEHGDLVEIRISGLGVLRNPVVRGKTSLERPPWPPR